MKLYKPVLIESAEQAEALPIGTMAYLDEGPTRHVAHKLQEDCWIRTDMGDLYSPAQDDCMCPGIFPDTWTALVPIEAEEERARSQINITHLPPPAPQMVPVRLPCPRCGLR